MKSTKDKKTIKILDEMIETEIFQTGIAYHCATDVINVVVTDYRNDEVYYIVVKKISDLYDVTKHFISNAEKEFWNNRINNLIH